MRNHLRVSSFAHCIGINQDYSAIYNALTLGLVIVRNDIAEQITTKEVTYPTKEEGSPETQRTIDELLRCRILLKSDQSEDEDYLRAKEHLERNIIGTLSLMLTDACNLRCSYCFVENRLPEEHDFSFMSKGDARNGIDLFVRHLPESIENGLEEPIINFYGGEPLMNFGVLEWALGYIDELIENNRLSKLRLTLNSNAILIDERIADTLKKHNVAVSVSIDGPEEIHDAARIDCFGKRSFERTMRGYSLLKDLGVDTGISCAVDEHNIDVLEDIVRWYINNLDVKIFGFNPLLEGGIHSAVFSWRDYSKKIGEKFVNCFRICRENGVHEERTMRLASCFAEGKIHYRDCSACGQQIVVEPKGEIGICHAYLDPKKYFIPYSPDLNLFKHPYWQEWRKRSPISMKECRPCIALGICGGGCPYNAEIRNGSIWKLDEVFCEFAKSMVNFLIRDVAERVLGERG